MSTVEACQAADRTSRTDALRSLCRGHQNDDKHTIERRDNGRQDVSPSRLISKFEALASGPPLDCEDSFRFRDHRPFFLFEAPAVARTNLEY